MQERPPEPRIDRSLTLHLRGDWGGANLHRICGWIAQELGDRTGPHTRIATWNSRGFVDAVRAVGRGEVHIALATPTVFVAGALDGRGPYAAESFPGLRALGVLPQRDRLVVGLDKQLGITTFEELRQAKPALRLATSAHDGVSHVGWAAHELLTRSGVDVVGWGGRILADERPPETLAHVIEGRANAVVHEAIMLPHWQRAAPGLNFLEVEADVLAELHDEFSWPDAVMPAGYLPGTPEFRTLDFSDFLVLTRDDLPDDVAYAVAWILGETRDQIEDQYRHLPPDRSPLTYPLDPAAMGVSPIPLHPGAARYYESLPK